MLKTGFSYLAVLLVLMILVFLAGCSSQVERVVNLLPPACSQEPDPGYCSAEISKYYFDLSEGACREFAWGGCGGFIPFETEQACQQVCLGVEEEAQR